MNWRLGRLGRSAMLGLAATGLMMAAGAAGAQAQHKAAAKPTGKTVASKMLEGLTADEIISILADKQIQAQKAPIEGNEPVILAMMPTGAKFYVRLLGCGEKGANCQMMQYGAIFTGADLPPADFNTFNYRYAFGKVYQDPQKLMYIVHSVSVTGGIRRSAVEANMFVFFNMADLFMRFLAERMSSLSASLEQPGGAKSPAITNAGGDLPAISSLASFKQAATRHPEIINKVHKGSFSAWRMK